jgi:hypothetical protein
MSDHNLPTDPIDNAYLQAEALLDDENARASRRARVLAAIAETPVDVAPASPSTSRSPPWSRGGWMAAASVGAVALLLATQVYKPVPTASPGSQPPPAPSAAPRANELPVPESPPRAAATPRTPEAAARVQNGSDRSEQIAAPSVDRVQEPTTTLAPAPTLPPRPAAQSARAAGSPADAQNLGLEEVVVTGSRVEASGRAETPETAARLARRLRQAAAAGRTGDLTALLARGAEVDAADEDGETALMKAVQAGQATAAEILRSRGASLDRRNHAGQSARDMAVALADPEVDRALSPDE